MDQDYREWQQRQTEEESNDVLSFETTKKH